MNRETLTEEQTKKIDYIKALLEKCIKECHEIIGGNPKPDMDLPSYCVEMARKCVLHEEY